MSIKDNKILILGGTGFLGQNLITQLKKLGNTTSLFEIGHNDVNIIYGNSDIDLLDYENGCLLYCLRCIKPDIVLNLSAHYGGISYNKENPVTVFEDNAQMIMNVFKACYKHKVKRLITIGSVCSYPKEPPLPFKEENIWDGCPEVTNAPYGIAKRIAFVLTDAYRKQYNFNSVNLVCGNMYGKHDHFNSDRGHVIPDLIAKIYIAIQKDDPEVEIWGSGKPTRDFLYVNDAVNIIIKFLEDIELGKNFNYINVGTGEEVPISMLAYRIAKELEYTGKFIWNESKPDGQPRRVLDTSRLKSIIGEYKFTNIQDGLKETIAWYKNFGD